MTKAEFIKIANAIKTYYPTEKLFPNEGALALWYEELKDLTYEVAYVAVRKHVNTSPYPPTISDIRKGAAGVTVDKSNWSDGWEQFRKAVSKYGYYQQEAALNSLDDLTRRVVKRLGWKQLCESENPMQDRANFRMIYEQEQQREEEKAALPAGLKTQIEQLQSGTVKAIGGGDDQQ